VSGSSLADRYEKLYPGALTDPAHKQERMERIDFKAEARDGRRSNRNRGIVVPALPVDELGRLRP